MPPTEKLDTHHKALTLNLDASAFGSFAEIGAGQEVSHWFFLVGGASATVAKTVSAYDKEVSDDLYGSGPRYVSRQRLEAMLDKEWTQLLAQLCETRGPHTRFFSFVDTVSARNFAGTNDPHGWVGLRFQLQPAAPPNDVLLHINMRDPSNVLQQEAIGVLGVHLIYAAFYELQTEESFLAGLAEDVVKERIEIDYVDLRGPAFEGWDRPTLLAHLVSGEFAEAVFFPSKDPGVPPTEALYNMKALVSRYTQAPVRFAVGLSLMIQAFEGIYGNLEGRLLEALARLLAQNVRIYVYPMRSAELCERLKGFSVSGWEWSATNGMFLPPSCGTRRLLDACLPIFSPATFSSRCKFPQP